MKVPAAIAEILKREGVDILFGYPRNAVLEAAAELDIRTVIVRQERTGLHMADAYSRMTRGKKMGVFAMQHGPGAENAYGGVAQAYSESVPVLVLPAGYARRLAFVPDNWNSSDLHGRGVQERRADHLPGGDVQRPAPRLHPASQRPASPGGGGDPLRPQRRGRSRALRVRARRAHPLRAGHGGRARRRRDPGGGPPAGDLRRPGRALGRGL